MRVPWKQAALILLPAAVLLWNAYLYSRGAEGGGAGSNPGIASQPDTGIPQQHNHGGGAAAAGSDSITAHHQQDAGAPQHHQEANDAHEVAAAAAARGPGIVQLNFMGRLGNNLFEYAAARALADRLGWALSIQPARYNVQKFGLLTRPEGMACFPGVRPVGPPLTSPEMAGLETVKFRGVRKELEDPAPRSIEMEGWFQDYGLFKTEKDRLRKVRFLRSCVFCSSFSLSLSLSLSLGGSSSLLSLSLSLSPASPSVLSCLAI